MASTVWKGYISFGLVSIPVRLNAAARNKTLPFHMLHKKDYSRVKEVFYCRSEDRPLEKDEIVKGYEVSKDEYVVIEDEELKKVAPPTAHVMELLQFVKEKEVDPIYFDKSYHVVPDAKLTRPYALLLEALKRSKHVGMAKVAMHNREHIVIIRPAGEELVLHTMFFKDEVREAEDIHLGDASFKPKEIELATKLIDTLEAKFEPDKFHDEYQENVKRLVEQKRKGEKLKPTPKPRLAPVVDLMEALQKSLSAKAKPATKAARKSAAKKAKATSKRSAA